MFSSTEKMRAEVRENGGFVKRMLCGEKRVDARALLRAKPERTLRNYCRVLQVEGLGKLRKAGLIEAVLDFAESNGYLAGGANAVKEVNTESNRVYTYPVSFVNVTAIEEGRREMMRAIQANYQYVGHIASLVKFGEELKAEALTSCDDVKALPATIENSDPDFYYYSDIITETGNKAITVREPERTFEPVPEVIEVEAVEIRKYPVEFCKEIERLPWGRKQFRNTKQIKMFPREFMIDESNLIRNTKPGVKRG